MKKFLSAVLAATMVVSMAAVSFAAPGQNVMGLDDVALEYKSDEANKLWVIGDTVPYGDTIYYQFLSNVENDNTNQSYTQGNTGVGVVANIVTDYKFVKSVSIKQNWDNSSRPVEKVEIIKKKYGTAANEYAYYLAIKTRESLSVKETDLTGTITLRKTGTEGFVNDATQTISHSVGVTLGYEVNDSDTVKDKYTVMFGNSSGDTTIDFAASPNSYFEVNLNGQSKMLVKVDTKYNSEIADKYPNANLDFFNGYDATFNRVGDMTLAAPEGSYLYQVKNGSLVTVKNTYDKYEEAFKFKTRTLGNYVISDRKLSTTVTPSEPVAPSEPETTTPTTPTNPSKPNPPTGAKA